MLAAFTRGLLSARGESTESRPVGHSPALTPEQIAAIVDARLLAHLEKEPTPSAPELDNLFAGFSEKPQDVFDRDAAEPLQRPRNGTYRPDSMSEDEPETPPWLSPT